MCNNEISFAMNKLQNVRSNTFSQKKHDKFAIDGEFHNV
jgi:hypothetical protein